MNPEKSIRDVSFWIMPPSYTLPYSRKGLQPCSLFRNFAGKVDPAALQAALIKVIKTLPLLQGKAEQGFVLVLS
jgi:hypothetical protein